MRDTSPKQEKMTREDTKICYRWDYETQYATDRKNTERKRSRGALTYTLTMAISFGLCLAILIGVVALTLTPEELLASGLPSNEPQSIVDVADKSLASTVLIMGVSAQRRGYGTGFFIREDGYIVTNCHVVQGYERSLSVQLYNGKTYPATVVGYYDVDDIAVIKIEGTGFPALPIGNSDAVRVGETAISLGNPGGDAAPWSVTSGIISALNRPVVVDDVREGMIIELKMLQTTAPLSPGNSGGPILNAHGEVIGVVTRRLAELDSIGLALPINGVMEIVDAIIKNGNADGVVSQISRMRPLLGINCSSIKKGDTFTLSGYRGEAKANGVLVHSVNENSGAYGVLQAGDVILAIDGVRVESMEAMTELLFLYDRGDEVTVHIARGENEQEERITLGMTFGG